MRIKGLTRIFSGSRATNTPRQTPNPPKRRPIQPQPSVLVSFAQWVCTVAAAPPQVAASPSPIGGNCTTRGFDTPATRRKKASCSAKPPSPPAWRTPGARRARRSAHEQRQGAAIARQLTQGRRQSTTQLSQQQPRRTPSVQNSPSTSSTAPLPVQNSPRTPTLTACPGQNSPCTPKMARFGAIYACGESFVPLWSAQH